MDFDLTRDQKDLRAAFRDFCNKEIDPRSREVDERAEFSWENYKNLAQFGFLGMGYAAQYGGGGLDALTTTILAEELARVCASTALSVAASGGLCGKFIERYGSEDQKKKYLPRLAKGEIVGAFCLTEPHSGSDAAGMKTVAVRKGQDYVLNGTKMFVTNGTIAEVFMVLARTDRGQGPKGISAFVVEKNGGVKPGNPLHKMGVRGSPTSEVVFEDCAVPKSGLVGEEGKGFQYVMQNLDLGRIGIATFSNGIAQACLDESVKYAVERKAFGKNIFEFQGVQFKIADMQARIETARLHTWRTAWRYARGENVTMDAAIAKLTASETAAQSATDAVQIHGGYGFIKEFKVERLYRDAKLGEIGEGTSEIQRVVIAREVLRSRG
ncbi:MAG: acyl-CoA dehydrogenase family protein [Nitrospirae bacterium]|nr:acyl-CoA dehydrogenase family protein [Nitrospirota bacterium]